MSAWWHIVHKVATCTTTWKTHLPNFVVWQVANLFGKWKKSLSNSLSFQLDKIEKVGPPSSKNLIATRPVDPSSPRAASSRLFASSRAMWRTTDVGRRSCLEGRRPPFLLWTPFLPCPTPPGHHLHRPAIICSSTTFICSARPSSILKWSRPSSPPLEYVAVPKQGHRPGQNVICSSQNKVSTIARPSTNLQYLFPSICSC